MLCATACCATASAACLAPAEPAERADARRVAVAPRVVMDGAVELGQRAQDRIVVDEVIFHAPSVVQLGADATHDVLATDTASAGPLLFRYDIASADGFGDVLGGARTWVLRDQGDGSSLEFAFSPFALVDSARALLEDATGVYLGELFGHTAYVHGYVLMSTPAGGFGAECDGDPDGNPADCTRADGDPDGSPAGPEPENDGDPDGNPADPAPRSDENADGDPDGNPAHPKGTAADDAAWADPSGASPADGDPDGNPAKPGGRRGFADASTRSRLPATTPVPFLLLLNAPFTMSVPADELLTADVAGDEVLPIDLHVSLAELFSVERVGAIEDVAAAQSSGAVVLEVTDTSALGIGVRADGVRRASESVSGGGIRVTGDLR
ncbi:MAG: hypothetical protein A2138_04780 [Deltaproteobacteria bacterium RBG_16_71_12]|nr:MAG: hypothetical protein A2138_04780 [Deltaproteobacteria bacterium RBG_16_71_12]